MTLNQENTLDNEDEGSVSGTLEGKRDGLTLTMEGAGMNLSLDVKKERRTSDIQWREV